MKKIASLALVALLVLAGCSSNGDSSEVISTPTSTPSAPSTQATPDATVIAFYEAIAKGDVPTACTLMSPSIDWPTATKGAFPTCQAALFANYTIGGPSNFGDVAVDTSKVTIDGDSAVVPDAAVTFAGKPSGDSDNPLVRIDGKWFLVPDFQP